MINAVVVLMSTPRPTSRPSDVGEANRVFANDYDKSETFPNPDHPTYWFKDWFYPIWLNYGQSTVLKNFFELLAEHFHQYNGEYARKLNMGEFLHFWSGAAGVNLKPLAITAFHWNEVPEWEQQFIQAQLDFPGVTYASS